ncbi:MAG: hypothetical protein A2408_02610 [Candidatus Yonathbacteria bacterium RIFOXYC1_FULL_52_10]|uniref:Glycosyltransferase 2-like domain-containing protein n=1 Tax=Candidatus Yonathbacteria bacterium RIFOXYD1_FULL_52_36 TaxID=1802730 RepID=A0A1G2SL04_9BACT|nr:MAG: hypothetical protein A2408_02610 [Candidatus Yonathbacteria bacterium RIFOXYC1_FULL_52_10]OHA85676.1 MAG: hypothetical protein A2591_02480 [Candidatus Yonathbacteria bacterium RIFOXYD1_FULL_52_36]
MNNPDTSSCIPATVAVLTYNSEETLVRCLDTVKGFCEILIADGGSTDGTLAIAERYGCRVIPQSNPGHPIEDFSLERNRTLEAASYDWFFYLDSDELMSPELKEEIREIASRPTIEHYIYAVPYYIKSHDLSIRYQQWKDYPQYRFFNRKSGARFVKKMHEKIRFDVAQYPPKKLKGPWYGTLPKEALVFSNYKKKVDYRLGTIAQKIHFKSAQQFFREALFLPLLNIAKQVFKIVYLRIRYRREEVIPLRYELFRTYSHLLLIKKLWGRMFRILLRRDK